MERGRTQSRRSRACPLFGARPGGPAERFAGRLRGRHPAAVFFAALLTGFAALAADLDRARAPRDRRAARQSAGCARGQQLRQVARRRAHTLPHRCVRGLLDRRRRAAASDPGRRDRARLRRPAQWRVAAFAVFVLMVESATYRVTSLAVPRDRPHVHRLEDLPADASYPSGHTAAAIAVYAGLVLLLTSRFPTRALRICAWAVAIVIPVLVALARMYRGMHHPLDIAGGLVIGIGALLVLLFATPRGGRGQRDARSRATARPRSPAPGRSHEGRGRRPRGEDARRRAARAASRARDGGCRQAALV